MIGVLSGNINTATVHVCLQAWRTAGGYCCLFFQVSALSWRGVKWSAMMQLLKWYSNGGDSEAYGKKKDRYQVGSHISWHPTSRKHHSRLIVCKCRPADAKTIHVKWMHKCSCAQWAQSIKEYTLTNKCFHLFFFPFHNGSLQQTPPLDQRPLASQSSSIIISCNNGRKRDGQQADCHQANTSLN